MQRIFPPVVLESSQRQGLPILVTTSRSVSPPHHIFERGVALRLKVEQIALIILGFCNPRLQRGIERYGILSGTNGWGCEGVIHWDKIETL